jgi:hypothetical protein
MSCYKNTPYQRLPYFEVRDFKIESLTILIQRHPLDDTLRAIAKMRVPSVKDGHTIDVVCEEQISERLAYEAPGALARCVECALRNALTHELHEKLFMDGEHVREPHPEGDRDT